MSKPVKTCTFLEFQEYDLYDSWSASVEVPHRDPATLDFRTLLKDSFIPVDGLAAPRTFRFYDADLDEDGQQINRRNPSKNYVIAEIVLPLADYQTREEDKIAQMRQEKHGLLSRTVSAFFDDGFSLVRAFKAAIRPGRPVMDWYIRHIETFLLVAKDNQATHVALFDRHGLSLPEEVTKDTIVLDKKLNQIFPANTQSTEKPAPKAH